MRPRVGVMYEYGYWMYDINDLMKSFGVRLVVQPFNVGTLVRLLGWDNIFSPDVFFVGLILELKAGERWMCIRDYWIEPPAVRYGSTSDDR